jgi:hypothetical protein
MANHLFWSADKLAFIRPLIVEGLPFRLIAARAAVKYHYPVTACAVACQAKKMGLERAVGRPRKSMTMPVSAICATVTPLPVADPAPVTPGPETV